MPGGPAKHPRLKILEGTFRKDRDEGGAWSAKPVGAPECPSWLPRSAKKYWARISEQMAAIGLISLLDEAAFSAHCDSVGKFAEVTKKLKTIEDMVVETPNGLEIQSALFQIRNKLWDQIRSSSTDFGLTPSSGCKIKPQKAEKKTLDGFEDL